MEIELEVLCEGGKIKKVTFYSMDAIEEFVENGEFYCTVYSSGMSFIVPFSYLADKQKLEGLLLKEVKV